MGAPVAHHPVEPHAEFVPHQLCRIGRAHGGQPVRPHQPGLERRDPPPELKPVRRITPGFEPQRGKPVRRGQPVKGDVVDRQDRACLAGAAHGVQIVGHEPRLPVMRVDHVRLPARDALYPDPRRDPAQGRKAFRVVGPVASVGAKVDRPVARIKMRRVQHQQVEPAGLRRQQPRRPAKEVRVGHHLGRVSQRPHDRRIARQERAQRHAQRRHGAGQGAYHIGQPAGFHQRGTFRCDRQHLCHFAAARLSSMSCVMSVTPRSDTRNHFASSSGSSPTTNPAGIVTPRSITTRRNRAERSTVT